MTDWVPFKKFYQWISPHMYDDMKAHLQEMLDIGLIWKSHSPWASMAVLVHKKNWSLRFCIDLRKLNNWTIKDSYLLPCIEENLNSLQGPQWFSLLNLKLGYWQVKMDDESKLLTAFTIRPLGFCECGRMPFGLTNAPAIFQWLMEICLIDLKPNCCIIYVDDTVIFLKDLTSHLERLEAIFQNWNWLGWNLSLPYVSCSTGRSHIWGTLSLLRE